MTYHGVVCDIYKSDIAITYLCLSHCKAANHIYTTMTSTLNVTAKVGWFYFCCKQKFVCIYRTEQHYNTITVNILC